MKIAFCADIHIGAPNTNLSEILSCIEDMLSQCDLLVIGGDILDAKFHASSEYITILLDVFDYITSIARPQRKKVRLIYGTQSHDGYPQLQILNPYTVLMDFKIIHHVSDENIDGVNILYIPEEIISDKASYYADTLYSGKKYDYIFGHGVIAEGMTMVKERTSTKKVKSVPVFKTEELKAAVKYHVCFGHYHRRWVLDNVSYVGSLSRFKHGEPETKGWYLMDKRNIEFHENQWCPQYTEHRINCSDYDINDFQTLIMDKINQFKSNSNDRDKLKFTITINRSAGNTIGYLDIIRTLCRGDGISYAINDVNDLVLQENVIDSEYDYILDQNIPIHEKIGRYNDSEFDGTLDVDLLKNYLSKTKVSDK